MFLTDLATPSAIARLAAVDVDSVPDADWSR
jgi:hypothetical protein